jgi:hypothetical protein
LQLERALTFVRDKVIDVDNVLASLANGKFAVKLPKVLNKATGKESSGQYQFSYQNWRDQMEDYVSSIKARTEDEIEDIILLAWKVLKKPATTAAESDSEEPVRKRALICMYFFLPAACH